MIFRILSLSLSVLGFIVSCLTYINHLHDPLTPLEAVWSVVDMFWILGSALSFIGVRQKPFVSISVDISAK